jgi:hypothetical protein
MHCHLLIEIIEIFPKLQRSLNWNMFWLKLKPHSKLKNQQATLSKTRETWNIWNIKNKFDNL